MWQGMSDLLAPILYVVRGEAEAFWCFKSLMDTMEANFHPDSAGTGTLLHSTSLMLERLLWRSHIE